MLTVGENFRRVPNGEVLARLDAGARLEVAGRTERWLEVELVGWVWMRSLQVSGQDEFGLIVSEPEGENLRTEPQGAVVGRLERGTLLEEVERVPGWIRVRRRGFVWASSAELPEDARQPEATAGAAATGPPPRSATPGPPPPAATRPGGFVNVGSDGAAILTGPDGDTLATASPEAELEVTAREGNWVRVRLEGWAWMPEASEDTASTGEILDPEALAQRPDAYRGRVVSWRLQFVSLERAEAIRTDFREGEPFLLARYGGDDGPFVYVAVPPNRAAEMNGIQPLAYLSVTGRVRTGASALTGTPILDLISFTRERRDP